MRPLIFEYAELPNEADFLTGETEYDAQLHLNVVKGTKDIAITKATFITDTFTKAQVDTGEGDDDLRFAIQDFLDTRLQTRQLVDETGSDEDRLSVN